MITAVPSTELPQVELTIDRPTTAAPLTVWRTDSAGTHPVRLVKGMNTQTPTVRLTDYEAGFGPLSYFTSDGESTEARLDWRLPTFSLPYIPTLWRTVPAVDIYDGPRTAPTTVHDVIDAPFPIATLRPLASRRGRMDALVRTWGEVKELEALLEVGQVVLYREADNGGGMDAYLIPLRVQPVHTAGLWRVTIEFAEAGRTSLPIDPRGRTFADLRDESDNFGELAASWSTFAAALAGEASL